MSDYVKIPSKETRLLTRISTTLDSVKKGEYVKAAFEGTLLEDGIYTLSKGELADAIVIILSDEFDDFCHAVLRHNECTASLNEQYENLIAQDCAPTTSQIYAFQACAKRCGSYNTKASMIKESIIERMGWSAWINATRLYETIFQIPRERLN